MWRLIMQSRNSVSLPADGYKPMTLPISVVIPCYLQEEWLGTAIESALNAGANEVRVFIDSPEKQPGYDICKLFRTARLSVAGIAYQFRTGVCFARNFLIQQAANDWLLCLDADDKLHPETLSELLGLWTSDSWVYPGQYTEIDEAGKALEHKDNPPPQLIFRKNLCYSTFLFHRDDWIKTGGYDSLFDFGDEDFALQVALTDAGVKPVRAHNASYERMIHERGSRTERAKKYFPMVLELLREKYPNTMHR